MDQDETRLRLNLWAFGSGITCLAVLWFAVRKYYTPGFFVFDGLPQLFFFCLLALVYLAIAFSAVGNWRRELRRGLGLPVTFLVVTLAVIAFISHQRRKRAAVPVLFAAYYDGDINGVGIHLRTDGTYEAMDGSLIGGSLIYGDYALNGDTIQLLTEHFRLDDEHWRYPKLLTIEGDTVVFQGWHLPPDDWTLRLRVTEDRRGAVGLAVE